MNRQDRPESPASDSPLRDELAAVRTHLANERTLLAYLRSGVALLIAGITIVHFAQAGWFHFVGVVCVPGGLLVSAIGVMRYRRVKGRIDRKEK